MALRNVSRDVREEFERIRGRLRQVVEESRFTQKEVAERSGLTHSVFRNLLREGGAGCYLDRILAIIEAIDVSPEDFFGGLYEESTSELKLLSRQLQAEVRSLTDIFVRLGFVTRRQLRLVQEQYLEDSEFPERDES